MHKPFDTPNAMDMSRRGLLLKGLTGAAAIGAAALTLPRPASADDGGSESSQAEAIHELQAAFHYAKSTQDIDLMMSLWAEDAVLVFNGVSYTGNDAIRAFLLTTGSFTHLRLSLVPSFKIQIEVHGDEAYLYFECVDIGNFDTSPVVAGVLYNAGTVRKIQGKWQFWRMNGGPASPLSVDHYYYP
jgi:ketosteroid isomerase-like protein